METSEIALSIDILKPYFLEVSNTFFHDLRFDTIIDVKAIGELQIFLDSFHMNDLQGHDDSWILDISTISKIKSEKRKISLAGITRSKVNLKLSNDDNGELFIQVLNIDFDWKALKTDVNGSQNTGVDNLARTLLNLAENIISQRLAELITSKINGIKKPYIIGIPPFEFLDTRFSVSAHVSNMSLLKLSANDHGIGSWFQMSISANVKDKNDQGKVRIDHVNIKESDEKQPKETISKSEVLLSDIFVNSLISSYLSDLKKDSDIPLDMNSINLLSDEGHYVVQIKTGNKATEQIEFDISFICTEFNNFPEIELSDFRIRGKGIVRVLAKQFIRVYKHKLSSLISEKWLDFISSRIAELKEKGIQYKWNELDIYIPIKNLEIQSLDIKTQKGIIIDTRITTGIIHISSNPDTKN